MARHVARHRAPQHGLLRRTARLSFVFGLSAAVFASAFALPAMAESVYTVKRGDTLSEVARKLGLPSWRSLYTANSDSISNPNLIFPGQRLVVPDGSSSAAERTTVKRTRKATSLRASRTARSSSSPAAGNSVWDRLAQCESGGNWSINTGNGYYGGLQFLPSTWRAHGGTGMPHQASREEQIRVAKRVLQTQGWSAWPVCSRKLGLR